MEFALERVIDCGEGSPGCASLLSGWALHEPGFTWAIGSESRLSVPIDSAASDYVLTLDVVPYLHPPELPAQRLIVSVNGSVLSASTIRRPALLAIPVSAGVVGRADMLDVRLQHPDAAGPTEFQPSGDKRVLAVAMSQVRLYRAESCESAASPGLMRSGAERPAFAAPVRRDGCAWLRDRTGLDPVALAFRFESLGENCEFGLFQRRCGAEPLGLLRFSSTFPRPLLRGIDDGFDGIGEPGDIEPRLEGGIRREFMIHEKCYELAYHSFVYEGERSVERMREQEAVRLKFLRRKFVEELKRPEKIFVYKRNNGAPEAEILALFMALRRHARHTLLWVTTAERDRPAGTVEVVMPGLLRGYIDRFAPEDNAHDLSFDGWLRVCGNAVALAAAAGCGR
jgi:hypothetical protein